MQSDWIMALLGGVLIGLASALFLLLNGRIFGVSGILGGVLDPKRGEVGWRVAVLAGLAAGGALLTVFLPEAFDQTSIRPVASTIAAGLLVGFGTRLGGGCTSGHGICGVGRLSKRSIVATALFVAAGMMTATIIQVLG